MRWPGERGYGEGEEGEPTLGLRSPSCSGWAEEAESAEEMERRWHSKSQRANDSVCS